SAAGQPERWAELCRQGLADHTRPMPVTRACLCIALTLTGRDDEAEAAAEGLLAASDTADNPNTACFALMGHACAHIESDPVAAYHAYRRALDTARESGNR